MAKAGLDKDAVLQTAIMIADEKGLSKITLKELAERLRVKTPSLYNYVDSLQGLYSMMAVFGLQSLRAELVEAVIGLSGKEAIYAMGKAYIRFPRKHPGLYEATQSVGNWQDERAKQLSDEIIKLVSKVMSAFPIAEQDVTHIIRMFRCLFHGFASLDRSEGFGNPVPVDDSFHIALEIMLEGIKTKYN